MSDDVVPAWLRTALAEEPEQCDLHVEGVRVRSYRWGKPGGTPVVLVHGGLSHAHWWDLSPRCCSGGRSSRTGLVRLVGNVYTSCL
jgi:pimeloyl-ACP methyl ester carboxylesterase